MTRVNTQIQGKSATTCVLLTAVEGASPADPANGLAWSVGVRGGGGDQVVVHIAVEAWLFSRGLLLHLSQKTTLKNHSPTEHFSTQEMFQLVLHGGTSGKIAKTLRKLLQKPEP